MKTWFQDDKEAVATERKAHEEQAEAKAAAKKAKKQRQKAARQQAQQAQQEPAVTEPQQAQQAKSHGQTAQQAQQLDQTDQQAQQAQHAQQAQQAQQKAEKQQQQSLLDHAHDHDQPCQPSLQQPGNVAEHDLNSCCEAAHSLAAASGHGQTCVAQSVAAGNDATEVQPAQARGSAGQVLSHATTVDQPLRTCELQARSFAADEATDTGQTGCHPCDEASAATFLQQLVCCPLTQVTLQPSAPYAKYALCYKASLLSGLA